MMKGNRDGFTIVESIVAMVMLSVILTALAGLMYYTAQQAVTSKDSMTRDGLALEMMNRLSTLPVASLPASYCDTVGSTRNQYMRCATITTSGRQTTIVIETAPMQRTATPVTYRFTRAAPPPPNPLCSPSC